MLGARMAPLNSAKGDVASMPDVVQRHLLAVAAFLAASVALAACGQGSTTTSTSAPSATASTIPVSTTSTSPTAIAAGFQPLAMSFVSPSLGFALGHYRCSQGECYQLVRSTDDGKNWSLVAPAGSVVASINPQGVYFADAARGWVWGKGAAFTANGGKIWSVLVLPAGSVVDSMAVVGAQAYFLLSTPTSSPPGTYVTSLFEQNWQAGGGTTPVGGFSPVDTPAPAGMLAPGASLLGVDTGQTGTASPLWIYDPTGGSSTSLPNPCAGSAGSASVPLMSGGRYLAAGSGNPASRARFHALCTSDPGAGSSAKQLYELVYSTSTTTSSSWTSLGASAPLGGLATDFATSPGANFAIGAASGASFVYAQQTGNSTWSSLTDSSLGGAPVTQLEWVDDAHVFAVIGGPEGAGLGPSSASVAYYSTDGGASFAKLTF